MPFEPAREPKRKLPSPDQRPRRERDERPAWSQQDFLRDVKPAVRPEPERPERERE